MEAKVIVLQQEITRLEGELKNLIGKKQSIEEDIRRYSQIKLSYKQDKHKIDFPLPGNITFSLTASLMFQQKEKKKKVSETIQQLENMLENIDQEIAKRNKKTIKLEKEKLSAKLARCKSKENKQRKREEKLEILNRKKKVLEANGIVQLPNKNKSSAVTHLVKLEKLVHSAPGDEYCRSSFFYDEPESEIENKANECSMDTESVVEE